MASVQGTGDASTLWYAVMRRAERGIFIGTLVLRHSDHHAFLIERGWEEIPSMRLGERGLIEAVTYDFWETIAREPDRSLLARRTRAGAS